ncbi:hypothetical protein niasHT_000150 [Heterodera trifolii]|uniref:B30.2/SPRY domain-containing protein n=1 Tax=Heterodera trifolii TaxID=157864 RepID=A0ABD2LSX1_9BILA
MSSFTTSSSSADEFSPLQPIFPNLSTSEEMSVLIARIAELNRAKTMEPSIASSAEMLGQDGYGMNDDGFSLDEEGEDEQQQEDRKTPTKDVSEDHLKAILERIGEAATTADKSYCGSIIKENCWDAFACHKAIEIIGNKSLIVHHKGPYVGWRSVFAKYSVLLNKHLSDSFYYEISVLNKYNFLIFGFAVKQQNKLDGTIRNEKSTYAYENDAEIWINGKGTNDEYSYGVGDTVGIGVNLASRQIIFTKNGLRLDNSDFSVDSSFADELFYPYVSLLSSDHKIEANFGPNFKFDLATL